MKKLLIFLLALFPIAASADDSGSCGENVAYTFVEETGTLTISGTGAMTDYTSSSSMPWNSYKSKIETVVVTDGVTSIGNSAFSFCSGLTSVTIGNGVESIGNFAFNHCTGLTSVTIPNSVTSIGNMAFAGCSGLTSINVDSGNTVYDSRENSNAIIKTSTNKLVAGCKSTVIPNSVTSIDNYAFYGCSGLTSVTIPNSVWFIGDYAFLDCSGLTSITIPNSVWFIGDLAFAYCSGLTSITVESGNAVYDSRGNCNAIIKTSTNTLIVGCKNTVIPNSVMSIDEVAFAYCGGLTSVTIPNSVTSIGGWAFQECGLTSVTIPNSVTSIGEYAFNGCNGLTFITIGNSVTSIGDEAFSFCSGLTSVICLAENVPTTDASAFNNSNIGNATLLVPAGSLAAYQATAPWSGFGTIAAITVTDSGSCGENVTYTFIEATGTLTISGTGAMTDYTSVSSIPWYSYRNSIQNIIVTNGVTSIGDGAFYSCSGLTSVTIPNSVTSIGDEAFSFCSGLTSVTIPNSVTAIGGYAFCECSGLTSITIPNSVTSIGNSAFEGCSSITSITIPNSVTSIGYYAFASCTSLTSITVESGNTVYDSRENCNAIIKTSTNELIAGCKNTVIPGSVTSIGLATFYGCPGLTAVTIPNNVTSIGSYAFEGCSGLTSITVESSNTVYDSRGNSNAIIKTSTNELIAGCKNTVIPNSVTSIGGHAFHGCSGLTSITIPNSVTSIGDHAFSDCSGLTSVTIPNSVTSIGYKAFDCCIGLTSVTCLVENVPTTNTNAFKNVNIGNVILVVPAGSIAAYQAAAPWSGFGQITDQTDISQIDNVIYIEPFEARPGRTEREVSIKMKNSAAIRGFQFDLVLPEGVTPVMEDEEIVCWLNDERSPKKAGGQYYHTLNVSQQADGSYRFLSGSTLDQTFSGNDGEIILLKVNVDENMAEGDYPIILKNIKLTESDIISYYETDVLLTKIMVQNYEIGDISGDGVVDVSDYIGVANHILGNSPAGFNAQAADVNEDNVVDVSDYIGIANIILTGSIYGNNNNAAPRMEEDEELDPQ